MKLVCFGVLATALWAQPGGIVGTWQGAIQAGAVTLRLGLHVSKNDKGELTSKLDSIDQGATGLPVALTTVSGNKVSLEMPAMRARFEGTLNAGGTEIAGTFLQGAAMPLTFKRVAKIEGLNRPQTPKPPFPYNAVEVAYETKSGIKLAGTLTEPKGAGPFAAAILITGSGPQDRDETLFEHKPFWVIADYLTRRGIAVLRVDDRGTGKSTGNSSRATLDDMADDVLAGVEHLKGRKEIDGRRIGVIGHSEGGIVGPAAAVRSGSIAFVVMLAGTGVDGEHLVYRQAELINRAAGASDAAVAKNRAVQEMIIDALRSESDEQAALAKMRAGWAQMKAASSEAERQQMGLGDAAMEGQFQAMLSPEMRSFLFFDPAPVLRKLKAPVLALNGSRDLQVPPSQNLPAIAAALAACCSWRKP
ncbi:MAG TPA: alpha/beta fold hydrolase [Bryobacteraceae bacterium]